MQWFQRQIRLYSEIGVEYDAVDHAPPHAPFASILRRAVDVGEGGMMEAPVLFVILLLTVARREGESAERELRRRC